MIASKIKSTAQAANAAAVTTNLLAWYDRHRRDLPWRAQPGAASDPYAVWLSEIMLQQTTVAAVKPYYTRFLLMWPDVRALAAAPVDDVMKAWAGLGYYSRARNLHACAQAVVREHDGRFPPNERALRLLPGIGAYTSAAISAIAFGHRAVVVDGNVERVMARLYAVETPLPQAKPALWAAMDAVTPDIRAGDFAQATMDLGATICTPKSPACVICPLMGLCSARRLGAPGEFPRKTPKKAVPERAGAVFVIEDAKGRILVRTRPSQGLFGGMTEFPGTEWSEQFDAPAGFVLPIKIEGLLRPLGFIHHGLTHFSLTLHVYVARCIGGDIDGHRWIEKEAIAAEALPTLMRKVLAKAQEQILPMDVR